MSVQNGERLATKQDLADMYQGILPYLGGMPEMLANKFSKGDLYSTDEKMIGQWTDGKPLYQKTIIGTLQENTWYTINSSEDIYIVDIKGVAREATGTVVSIPYANTGNYTLSIVANNTEHRGQFAFFGNVSYYANQNFCVTIQYTKTTDSPISIGNDTDYSTEEKIIGTWIDGKLLYQKTINIGNIPSATGTTIAHNISDIDTVTSVTGMGVKSASGVTTTIAIPYYRDSSNFIGVQADNTYVQFYTQGYSSYTGIITLQYTKTN